MTDKLFKHAIIFDPCSRGMDKQCFAVARSLAEKFSVYISLADVPPEAREHDKVLLISCGSGLSSNSSLELKALDRKKFFALQLMDPNEGAMQFDLIVSPSFETKVYAGLKNVLHVMTVPSNDEEEIEDFKLIRWRNWFRSSDKALTAVLVGGTSQFQQITNEDYTQLCKTLCKRAIKDDHNLFFITSPRTSPEFAKISVDVCKKYGVKRSVNEWRKHQGQDSVVMAALRNVNDIVVTGDSGSMISEAVYFARNITIATNGGFGNPRYARLHNELLNRRLVTILSEESQIIPPHERGSVPNPLMEIREEVERLLAQKGRGQTP